MNPTVVSNWACGECAIAYTAESIAAKCCTCNVCGGPRTERYWLTCDPCQAADRDVKKADREAAEQALPIVEYQGGPVNAAGQFFEDAYEAAEMGWDDGDEPTEAIAHECTVEKVGTPDLLDIVSETWAGNFDEEPPDMPADAVILLKETQEKLDSLAPNCWIPRMKERIVLPPHHDPKDTP